MKKKKKKKKLSNVLSERHFFVHSSLRAQGAGSLFLNPGFDLPLAFFLKGLWNPRGGECSLWAVALQLLPNTCPASRSNLNPAQCWENPRSTSRYLPSGIPTPSPLIIGLDESGSLHFPCSHLWGTLLTSHNWQQFSKIRVFLFLSVSFQAPRFAFLPTSPG